MSFLAILPILPTLGGVVWALAGLAGLLLSLLHPRSWRMWGALLHSQWRGLAVLAAAALVAYGAWTLWGGAAPSPSAAAVELALDGWPMIRGSLSRTGCTGGPGPSAGGVEWTGRSDYEFLGSPAVSGPYVVAIGSRGDAARCFCWEAATGREVWSGAPHGYRQTLSSPILVQGRIYCGEGVHRTPRSRVLCLDPSREREPVVWELATNSHVECTPAYAEGCLYVAAGDDGVYALEAATDSESSPTSLGSSGLAPRVRWHVPGPVLPDAETALAVHDDRVYVGLGYDTPALVMLDAATGRELAREGLPLPAFAPPTLFAGGWLLGLGPGNLITAPTAGAGEIRWIDPETLRLRWRVPTTASVVNAAAVAGDIAIVTVADGTVLAVTAEGEVARSWRAFAPVLAAAAIAEPFVYIVSQDGLLTALDLATFAPRWNVRLGPPGRYLSSPVVHQGRVYVGTPAGLMCVGRVESP
jgi:outer membrane protein assembly factor BamB